MYSDADLQRPPPAASPAPTAPPPSSAEAIALALLAHFHQRHLPRAADLEWLVSEADAPQSLLPLPDSVPVSPDDLGEHSDLRPPQRAPTRLRGDLEWAPPRAQIVFNVHPTEKRKVVLSKQNFRCAGCGAKVENSTMKRYRFCEYLGKYFCPCCHTNKQYYIPARILHRWDFRLHPVSNFAFELLHRIQTDPLYSVDAINPGLYKKQKSLDSVRVLRLQLQHLSVFLATCRLARSLHDKLARLPTHAATDVHLYSLNELLQIHAGSLVPRLRTMVNDAVAHVTQCQLCRARGFICELCHSDDVLFPFELWRVTQCARCHGCCHARCVSAAAACPKCARIDARRRRRDQETPSPEPPNQ